MLKESVIKTYELGARNVYKSITQKKYMLIVFLLIFCVISLTFDIVTGPATLSFHDVINSIFNPKEIDVTSNVIIKNMRMPMSIMALLVGASLGLAGAVMQTILGNPLASPYTLGVGAAAAFGASLAIVMKIGNIPVIGTYMISINAFLCAMIVCTLMYILGKIRGMSTNTMVLAGIALLFMFNALQALIQYGASEEQVQSIVFWSFGSMQKTNWPKLLIVLVVFLICFPILMRYSWEFTALLLGTEKAESLGVDVNRLKLKSFVLISLLSAVSVCFVGTIGFIGLAGPHIARMLVGEDQRFYLPVSALGGALLLSVASTISKIIIPGTIFPIGIITSIIGVPFFFILILRKKAY